MFYLFCLWNRHVIALFFIDEETKGHKGHTNADINGWNNQGLNTGSLTKFKSSYLKLMCSITLYMKVVCVIYPHTWRFYVNRKSAVWQRECAVWQKENIYVQRNEETKQDNWSFYENLVLCVFNENKKVWK